MDGHQPRLEQIQSEDYSCTNFGKKDGIQNYEYNTGAALKLKDGTLLIGGITGYNIIEPDKIENKKLLPRGSHSFLQSIR